MIRSGNPNAAPFTTNATGVATGLNADRGRRPLGRRDRRRRRATLTKVAAVAARHRRAERRARREQRHRARAVGTYTVTFDADVSACAYSATVIGGESELGFATVEPVDARTLRVRTRAAADGQPARPTARSTSSATC